MRRPKRLAIATFALVSKDRGHELVATCADLLVNAAARHIMAEIPEGFLPGLNMSVVGIDKGAVEIEDYSVKQGPSPLRQDGYPLPRRFNALPG